MASTFNLLSESHFLCSLCEDVFTKPVTTPCGHSFCKACLHHYWTRLRAGRSHLCPLCGRGFSAQPDLSINHILADVSEKFRKIRLEKPSEKSPKMESRTEAEVDQMIQERLQKVDKLRHSLQILQSYCLKEVRDSQRVFAALQSAMESSHRGVVTAIEERQKEVERRVEQLVNELEQEIDELKNGSAETEPNRSDDKEPVAVTTPLKFFSEKRDWSRVTVETDPCVGVTRRALSDLVDKVQQEVNRFSKSELKRLQKYTAEVTLNPKTAHAHLFLSEDRRQVRHSKKRQDVSDSAKRFDRVPNILGREGFSFGRHYWEVEVGDKTEWTVGVARETVNRKGKFTVCPANGYFTVSLKNGSQYLANTAPPTPLCLGHRAWRVGVFLDHDGGKVSFYCVETGTHMYTFTETFTDRLHPFFNPGDQSGGRNIAPLTITSSCSSI